MLRKTHKVKKIALVLAVMMIASLAFTACGNDNDNDNNNQTEQLNLYGWSGLFPQDVIDGFTEETGIQVNYNNFDSNETMLTRLQAAEGGEYDLIIADDYILETVIGEGLAQEMDTSKMSNYGNINPAYQGLFYDPDNKYTIPYGAGVITLIYNEDEVDTEITGYEGLWDPSLRDSVCLVASDRVVDGMALKINGESFNTNDVEKIREAGEKLQELAPNVRIIRNEDLQNELLSGEVKAGAMFTSQITLAMTQAQQQGLNFKTVYPEEGIGFGTMAGFIPSNAPNADAAYKFLNYILDGEIGAKCFEHIGYYSTNAAADEYISDDMKAYLTPPEDLNQDDMEMVQSIDEAAQAEHNKIWTEFRQAAGQPASPEGE